MPLCQIISVKRVEKIVVPFYVSTLVTIVPETFIVQTLSLIGKLGAIRKLFYCFEKIYHYMTMKYNFI